MIGKVDEINGQKTITPLSGSDKQEIFDVVYPIGCTYVQYPQQKSPNTLFNSDSVTSEWEALNYSGAFFRSNGGNAKAFVEEGGTLSLQANQNKYHRHTTNSQSATSTGGMSGNSSGSAYYVHFNQDPWTSGNMSIGGEADYWTKSGSSTRFCSVRQLSINVAHTHDFSHTHDTNYNGSSSDQEARPDNYTIKIWKRIA